MQNSEVEASLVSEARRLAEMTAAEFDYSLATGKGAAAHWLWWAIENAATSGMAEVTPETPASLPEEREQARREARERYRAGVAAMIEAAQSKAYTGWSNASREPIRYAARGERI